jgi:dTDP-4-dehydrorhamnose reductase
MGQILHYTARQLVSNHLTTDTYHATGDGFTIWRSFAQAIFTEAAAHGGPCPKIHAITTADYPTKAKRPADGRLDSGKLSRVFGVALPPWEQCMKRVIVALRKG